MEKLIGATAETIYFSCYSLPGKFKIPASLLSLREKIANPEPASGGTLAPKLKPRALSWPWMFDYETWHQTKAGMKRRPGHIAFEIAPRGMSHFYYVLKNDDMQIQAVRHPSITYPTVHIQIRARLIWAVGYENALRYCLDVGAAIFGALARSALARVDFTVDIHGWKPTAEGLRTGLVGRPVKKEIAITTDQTAIFDYYKGSNFTGIAVGKGGDVMCRIYDKTAEIIANSTKTWFYEIWKKNGWPGKGKVWRVEFQCRRPALRAFGFGDSLESLDRFAGMFRYLTNDWLRLTVPNPMQRRRDRLITDPVWKLVQGANFGNGGDISREAQKLPERKHLMDQFKGLATTIAARHGIDDEPGLVDFVLSVICGEFNPEQLERLRQKKSLYDAMSLVNSTNKKTGVAQRRQDIKGR